MASSPLGKATIILSFISFLIACSPDENSLLSTDLPPTATPQLQLANLVITSASLEWPEIHPPEPCIAQLPSPTIHICVQNQGGAPGAAKHAFIAMPAELAPAVQAAILGSLPGGNWKPAEFIPVEGLPGAEGSAQGIIIVNSMPGPDGGVEGIIIINNMPGAFEGAEGIIIVENMPGPGVSGNGIMIVNNLPGDEASQVMGIIMEDKPGEDGSSAGIVIVFGGVPPDDGKPPPDDNIVWGGIVWGGTEGLTGEIEGFIPLLLPPPGDNIVWGGFVWGGMPAVEGGTQGIIIINNLPGPDSGAEGVIINSMPGAPDISQVMGIIMEDKPGEDGSSAGIVIVFGGVPPDDGKPPPDDNIVWGGIVWGGMPGEEGSSAGIIVQNMPGVESGAESAVWTGMPFGFEMGEGMMAMMGEGGFGPGPYLLGRLELSNLGFPAELVAGEESCVQVAVMPVGSEGMGGPDSGMSPDSFFDVFVEIDTSQPQSVDPASGAVQVVQVALPSIPMCTPIPSPTNTNRPPTATPTRPAPAPPANTPTYFRPSPTPQRYVPTPTPLPPRT